MVDDVPDVPQVQACCGPGIIGNNPGKNSYFLAGGKQKLSEESRIPAQDLVSKACLIFGKVPLYKVGECTSGHLPGQLNTGIPAFEYLFHRVGLKLPEHATIPIAAKYSDL